MSYKIINNKVLSGPQLQERLEYYSGELLKLSNMFKGLKSIKSTPDVSSAIDNLTGIQQKWIKLFQEYLSDNIDINLDSMHLKAPPISDRWYLLNSLLSFLKLQTRILNNKETTIDIVNKKYLDTVGSLGAILSKNSQDYDVVAGLVEMFNKSKLIKKLPPGISSGLKPSILPIVEELVYSARDELRNFYKKESIDTYTWDKNSADIKNINSILKDFYIKMRSIFGDSISSNRETPARFLTSLTPLYTSFVRLYKIIPSSGDAYWESVDKIAHIIEKMCNLDF